MITVFVIPQLTAGFPATQVTDDWHTVLPQSVRGIESMTIVEPLDAGGVSREDRPTWIFGSQPPGVGFIQLDFAEGDWRTVNSEIVSCYSEVLGELHGIERISVFGTTGNVVVPGENNWSAQPCVRATFFARRRRDVGLGEFSRHWREDHAAIVPETPHLLRYVQGHVVGSASIGGQSEPCDGIAQLWWPSIQLMTEAMESHTMQVTQPADAAQFVDVEAQYGFVGHERILRPT